MKISKKDKLKLNRAFLITNKLYSKAKQGKTSFSLADEQELLEAWEDLGYK